MNRPTPRAPTLVYFGHVPAEGAGSAIIVLRHLRRFAANGYEVRVVADWGQDHSICRDVGWPVLELSHRRAWWPPFNADSVISRRIRTWLWAGEVWSWLGKIRPAAVFNYLSAFSDVLSLAAAGFARRFRRPLTTIIHDDARAFSQDEKAANLAHARRQWILQNSRRAWFASPELASCFTLRPEQVGVLPPIPDGHRGTAHWKPAFAKTPLVVYAGNYWPAQLPLLARIGRETVAAGGQLMLMVKKSPEIEALCREQPVLWQEPFRENREALAFLVENAAGLLVSYAETTEAMPWVRTSFPSKLIEYTHLGIPILIYTPPDTAVAAWAKQREFSDFATPQTEGAIGRFVNTLKSRQCWEQQGAAARRYALTEFDPARIQETLEAGLRD